MTVMTEAIKVISTEANSISLFNEDGDRMTKKVEEPLATASKVDPSDISLQRNVEPMIAPSSLVASTTVPDNIEINKIFKILIVGNAKCGKSSIISRYVYNNHMDERYKTTIGADFVRKDILVNTGSNNMLGVRLQLWDIAGQDRFQKLTRAYFNKARGVVLVCDVSREGTIDSIRNWKVEIDNWIEMADSRMIPIVLFANKADLMTNASDAFKLGAVMERLCRELNISGWWVTSAKTGENIVEGFDHLVQDILTEESNHEPMVTTQNSVRERSGVIIVSDINSDGGSDDDDNISVYYRSRMLKNGDCC